MHTCEIETTITPAMIEEMRRELDATTDAEWRGIALQDAARCRGMARSAWRHRSGKYNSIAADVWEQQACANEQVNSRAEYDAVSRSWRAWLNQHHATRWKRTDAPTA